MEQVVNEVVIYEEDELESEDIIKNIDDILYDEFERKLIEYELQEEDELEDLEAIKKLNVSLEQAVLDFNQGCSEAFDYIYSQYKPKLERLSYRQNNDELLSELSEVLLKAVQTFNANCGAKFNTYYWKCARNHIGTLKIYNSAKKRKPSNGIVSIDKKLNTEGDNLEFGDMIEDEDSIRKMEEQILHVFLETKVYPFLSKDEITAIDMTLKGYTLDEIGTALGGITAPAVHIKLRRLAKKKNIGIQLETLKQRNY